MTEQEWGQIEHFKPDGTIDNFGDPYKMDFRLLWALDRLRDRIGKPFIVHCGYDTEGHLPNSLHKMGQAVDFHVKGIKVFDMAEILNVVWWFGGLGVYPHWNKPGFHIDIGPYRRWHKNKYGAYMSPDH